ncbi:hypothetical protein AOQ84DRAFT_388446 [Glonium stellatum]|uniref:Uncharacterized protein n=1 Tax=Glonium stellatum TaxID=574774 RepID=A0A8E2F2P1_9PEZI|nr:hypothetical protein AOQ84DRAFT_388446 [Glonium stellatum]
MNHSGCDTPHTHSSPKPDAAEAKPDLVDWKIEHFDIVEREGVAYVVANLQSLLKYSDRDEERPHDFCMDWSKFRQTPGAIYIIRRSFKMSPTVENYLGELQDKGLEEEEISDNSQPRFWYFGLVKR